MLVKEDCKLGQIPLSPHWSWGSPLSPHWSWGELSCGCSGMYGGWLLRALGLQKAGNVSHRR